MRANENRVHWIDNLKAIGIYLMVLSHHETIAHGFLKYIFSFHMPLFFFISGFLFDRSKYPTIKSFVLKRTQTLLVPYFFFSFICYIVWCVLLIIRHPKQITSENNELLKTFLSIFVSSNGITWMSHAPPLWFLTCLFLLEIQFYIILKVVRGENTFQKALLILIVVFISICGHIDYLYFRFHIPWGLEISWTVMIFYLSGYIVQSLKSGHLVNINYRALIIMLLLGIVSSQMNSFVNLTVNKTGNYVLLLVSAFAGIGCFITVSQIIRKNSWMEYLGKNTIFVLGFHNISVSLCIGLLSIFSMKDLYYNGNTYISALLSALQIVLILLFIPIAQKTLFRLNVRLFPQKAN